MSLYLFVVCVYIIGTGTVQEAIEEILAMAVHNHTPSHLALSHSDNYQLKICGKDEYMDG